jgi:hypothetical protein
MSISLQSESCRPDLCVCVTVVRLSEIAGRGVEACRPRHGLLLI